MAEYITGDAVRDGGDRVSARLIPRMGGPEDGGGVAVDLGPYLLLITVGGGAAAAPLCPASSSSFNAPKPAAKFADFAVPGREECKWCCSPKCLIWFGEFCWACCGLPLLVPSDPKTRGVLTCPWRGGDFWSATTGLALYLFSVPVFRSGALGTGNCGGDMSPWFGGRASGTAAGAAV